MSYSRVYLSIYSSTFSSHNMAYGRDGQQHMGATFVPGLYDDYNPPPAPELISPEPKR